MAWINEHLGSIGHMGDFYIPQQGNIGGASGESGKIVKTPRVVRTNEYDYPRIQKFFDWELFLDYVDWSGRESMRSSHLVTQRRYEHTLTRTFKDAMDLARGGWHGGLSQLKSMPQIKLPFCERLQQTYNIQTKYDIAGGTVNIGRYLSGMPDCMRRINTTLVHNLPARIQKVFIYGTFHRHVPVSDVIKRGYTVYQIIEALEMANIQTEITLAFSTNKDNMQSEDDYDFYETYIKIKDTTDIIYPEKLLFCLAHPSMLRRLVFSEWERNNWRIREHFHFYGIDDQDHGYGACIPDWLPPSTLTKDAIVIPYIENTDGMDDVLKKVEKLIKSQYERAR